jgi:hypothetical protein
MSVLPRLFLPSGDLLNEKACARSQRVGTARSFAGVTLVKRYLTRALPEPRHDVAVGAGEQHAVALEDVLVVVDDHRARRRVHVSRDSPMRTLRRRAGS